VPPALTWTLLSLLAYLLGAVPFGLLVGKWVKGIDLRDHGSGNLGATNALRVLGKPLGALTLLLDAGKGLTPVLAFPPLAAALGAPAPAWLPAVLGGLAVLGHVFPVYLRFRGGKGVATSAGALGALHPAAFGVAFGTFFLAVAATRMVSLGSVLAAVALPTAAVLLDGPAAAFGEHVARTILFLLAAVLVLVRHRANVGRILAGTERRLGQRVATEGEPANAAAGAEADADSA
jgi:glycerol-3-phosphate acyltransferase PlsY